MKLCERPGTPKKRPKSSNENHIQEFPNKDQKPSVYSVSTDFSAKESVESDSQEDTSREMSLMEESESTLSDSVPKEPSQQFIVLGATILKPFFEKIFQKPYFSLGIFLSCVASSWNCVLKVRSLIKRGVNLV